MSLAQVRAKRLAKVIAPSVEDVVNLFVERNSDQRVAFAPKGDTVVLIKVLLKQITENLVEEATAAQPVIDDETGEGLGVQLESGEAMRRLRAFATPVKIEDWAGGVAGPSEVTRRYGVSRSTLHDWEKRGAVIGLLVGRRKHVFPLAQFIDGRPIDGLAEVLTAIGSPRTAWLWLVEPHPYFRGRKPLDRLKAGDTRGVIDLAQRDFGQS